MGNTWSALPVSGWHLHMIGRHSHSGSQNAEFKGDEEARRAGGSISPGWHQRADPGKVHIFPGTPALASVFLPAGTWMQLECQRMRPGESGPRVVHSF